jgi:hypothetical protein
MTTSSPGSQSLPPQSFVSDSSAAVSCSAILPNATINASVRAALTTVLAGLGDGSRVASVENTVIIFFWQVCGTPTFISLVDTWGAANVTLDFSVNSVSGLYFANFSVLWSNWDSGIDYVYQEWWAGNLTSDVLSGPYEENGQAGPTYGPGPRDMGSGEIYMPVEITVAGVIVVLMVAAGTIWTIRRRVAFELRTDAVSEEGVVGESDRSDVSTAPDENAPAPASNREIEPEDEDQLRDVF